MSRQGAQDTPGGATQEPHRAARSDRNLEDAAAVLVVIAAVSTAASAAQTPVPHGESPRSVWGSPAHRLGVLEPGTHTWWSTGAGR